MTDEASHEVEISGGGKTPLPGADVSYYVVALLDILGQSDKLEEIHKIQLSDESQRERLVSLVQDTGELVKAIRRMFHLYFRELRKPPAPLSSGMTDVQRQIWADLKRCDVSFMSFSDTHCAFQTLEAPSGSPLECARIVGLQSILHSCCATMLLFMGTVNKTLRGGIAVSLAWPISEVRNAAGQRCEVEIYGPALSCAHRCESKRAQWPRIVVDQSVLEYLDSFTHLGSNPYESWLDASIRGHLINMWTSFVVLFRGVCIQLPFLQDGRSRGPDRRAVGFVGALFEGEAATCRWAGPSVAVVA